LNKCISPSNIVEGSGGTAGRIITGFFKDNCLAEAETQFLIARIEFWNAELINDQLMLSLKKKC
jgi:hypothetical protein